jgi:hypothetical protein
VKNLIWPDYTYRSKRIKGELMESGQIIHQSRPKWEGKHRGSPNKKRGPTAIDAATGPQQSGFAPVAQAIGYTH